MSVSVSGTSAVPVTPLRVLRRHSPLGRLTVPGRTIAATTQRAVDLAQLVEHADQIGVGQPARRGIRRDASCSLTSGRGSSPSVELIVRSLAGEMSASG